MSGGAGRQSAGALARGYLPMVGGQLSGLLAGFGTSVVLVGALGADGRGVVALLATATLVAVSVLSGGLEGAMARQAGASGLATATGMALWWSVTAGAVFTAGWGIAGALGTGLWRLDAASAAALAAFGMFAGFLASLLRGVLLGGGGYGWISAARAAQAVLLLGGVLVLAAADALTAERALVVTFVATALQCLVHWWGTGRRTSVGITRAARATHAGYAVRSSLGTLFLAVQSRWDLLVVGALLTTTDAGIYVVLLSVSELAWLPIDVAALMILGSAASGSHRVQEAAVAARLVALLALGVALALAAVGPVLLLEVFGRAFRDEFHVLLLLLPGAVALAVWRFTMSDAAGRGQPELRSRSAAAGSVVALVLVPVAVPTLGLAGAALASTLSYVLTAAVGIRGYARSYDVPVGRLLRPRIADVRRLAVLARRAARRSPRP